MSAFLDTSSAIIGDYMLRGWTLTDRTCNHCHLTPLMRQPLREVETEAQREEFCATCQGGPGRAVRPPQSTQTDSNANGPVSNVNAAHNGVNGANGHSRSVSDSTSFGDLSSSKSEPEMDMSFEIPAHIATVTPAVENPSFTERDAQSARASSLIGDMLLRGFSLGG
ncbi:hypothetical protein QFC19_006717 [Naganishia cerealis]|uniref:Uncharacterized protein n=1 Tax=Naganishia cerealis TaxID=610337 RepID=A0ACC2VEI5_9TREE|nr:hypothetical protein QFC19_006717 [Naganishia cerealis]